MTCPPPGDLPDPGIEPQSSALAGRFFTIWATGEALFYAQNQACIYVNPNLEIHPLCSYASSYQQNSHEPSLHFLSEGTGQVGLKVGVGASPLSPHFLGSLREWTAQRRVGNGAASARVSGRVTGAEDSARWFTLVIQM